MLRNAMLRSAALVSAGLSLTLASGGLISPALSEVAAASSAPPESQTITPEAQAITLAARLHDRLSTLLERPQPLLFERHLRSVRALIDQEVLMLSIGGSGRTGEAQDPLPYLQDIERGLDEDAEDPAAYLSNGLRALTLARRSRLDGSLQYYTVNLPPNWDPNRAYPLFVSLHGAGPSLPISYVGFTFAPHGRVSAPNPPQNAAAPPPIITISPWLRGNQPWVAGGEMETDIWEAIEDLQSFARIDPDRRYVIGFSGGGDDAWALAMRTPDQWAGAGMMAGSPYGAPVELDIAVNASNVPFYFWSGDSDQTHRLPDAQKARNALAALGDETEFVISPGVGHTYRWQDDFAMRLWLIQHVRRRPDHFSFVADTPEHRGAWGITIPRRYPYAQRPPEPVARFECLIRGQRVRIDTSNARALLVDLGPNGLRITGTVSVVVNGRERFRGMPPAEPISLTNL